MTRYLFDQTVLVEKIYINGVLGVGKVTDVVSMVAVRTVRTMRSMEDSLTLIPGIHHRMCALYPWVIPPCRPRVDVMHRDGSRDHPHCD